MVIDIGREDDTLSTEQIIGGTKVGEDVFMLPGGVSVIIDSCSLELGASNEFNCGELFSKEELEEINSNTFLL
jgi:hypothetical protein